MQEPCTAMLLILNQSSGMFVDPLDNNLLMPAGSAALQVGALVAG
jgi:hypothetical protein